MLFFGLLGITVHWGDDRPVGPATAGDAGSTTRARLAAPARAAGLRAPVAPTRRRRPRGRHGARRPGRGGHGPDRRGPRLETGDRRPVQQGRPVRRDRAADGADAGARPADPGAAATLADQE